MSVFPSRLLLATTTNVSPTDSWTVDDGTNDPWVGYPYRWSVTFNVSFQPHSSHLTPTPYQYNATNISVGDWFADFVSGTAVKVIQVEDTQSTDTVTCIVEDVDRFNLFNDPTQQGVGFGGGAGAFFTIGDDGLPILSPMTASFTVLGQNLAWQMDQISRFRYRNYLRSHQSVNQTNHGFVVGNLLTMTSSGAYAKATASATATQIVGSVIDIGIPGPAWFSYRPVGRIDLNLPTLPGTPGSLVYVAPDGTLTASKPTVWAKPVYLRLESPNKGIVLDRSVEGTNSMGYSSQIYVVSSLAARNALTNLNPGDQAFVQDVGNGEWSHFIYAMGGTWGLLVTQDASNTDSYSKQITVTNQSDPNGIIATVSDGRRVDEVIVEVTTAFNGAATLSVGTQADNEMLMTIDQNDLSTAGTYKIDPAHLFNTGGSDTPVKYYLTTNSTTTGTAIVSITYS